MEVRELLADLNTNVGKVQSDTSAIRAQNDEAHKRFSESLERHTAKLTLLDNSIRGNGGAGLNERMNRAEWFIRGVRRFRWLLIGAALTTLGAMVLTLIVAFVH